MSAPPSRTSPKEVFLSHAGADRELADRLAQTMRFHHVPVWYSQTDLFGGHQWLDEIGLALKRCDWFVLLLSPAAVQSLWVKHEVHYVLGQTRYVDRIMPLLCQPCDPFPLGWPLGGIQRIDFTADFDQGCAALFRAWGLSYQPAE